MNNDKWYPLIIVGGIIGEIIGGGLIIPWIVKYWHWVLS
jgi:hypothetical protein